MQFLLVISIRYQANKRMKTNVMKSFNYLSNYRYLSGVI